MLSRRSVLRAGGGLLAGLLPAPAATQEIVEVRMRGTADGSEVWFDPIGLVIRPGQTIRWTNIDPGNSHTSTAYHPQNDNHALRIPDTAASWNSDYLLPDESFAVVLTVEGVYDYYCIPHEHAGMVGRIIVSRRAGPGMRPLPDVRADQKGWQPVPELAEAAFPAGKRFSAPERSEYLDRSAAWTLYERSSRASYLSRHSINECLSRLRT